jgi:hypothetical protein
MANQLAQQIESILDEELGNFIAKATVKKNCEQIGATMDTITAAQLPELAVKIGKSVKFFSGEDVGNAIAEKIRAIKA